MRDRRSGRGQLRPGERSRLMPPPQRTALYQPRRSAEARTDPVPQDRLRNTPRLRTCVACRLSWPAADWADFPFARTVWGESVYDEARHDGKSSSNFRERAKLEARATGEHFLDSRRPPHADDLLEGSDACDPTRPRAKIVRLELAAGTGLIVGALAAQGRRPKTPVRDRRPFWRLQPRCALQP